MDNLIRQLIETLHSANKCPRIMVDSMVPEVDVPEHVRERWRDALPIDLDPTYPLNLQFEDGGIRCCLSFGGAVDCYLPWPSIYLVQDRDTHVGLVLDGNLPDSVRARIEESGDAEAVAGLGRTGEDEAIGGHENMVRLIENPGGEELASSGPSEVAAQRRRSLFRVIEGGQD